MPDCRKSLLIFQNFLGEAARTPPALVPSALSLWLRPFTGPPLSKIPGSTPGEWCVGKGKGDTLDTALLSEGTSLQKHSGKARVIEGFHSSACTPTLSSMDGMNFAFPAEAGSHLPTPEGWKAELA